MNMNCVDYGFWFQWDMIFKLTRQDIGKLQLTNILAGEFEYHVPLKPEAVIHAIHVHLFATLKKTFTAILSIPPPMCRRWRY